MSDNRADFIIVDSLRAGITCPACLKPLAEGETAALCSKCGSLNHEICWQRNGCGSYHCQKAGCRIDEGSPDIVITKADLAGLKEVPANSRYGTAAIADDLARQKKAGWSPLAIIALSIGFLTLSVSLVNFFGGSSFQGQTFAFLLSLGGCLLSVLIGAIAMASFQGNSAQKGLLLAMTGMGCGILALILTVYPLATSSSEERIDEVKLDMKQISETVRNAQPLIRAPLMANVAIKSGSGFRAGTGSGIALCNRDSFTYILTNAHVLSLGTRVRDLSELEKKADEVEVTFFSGESVKGVPVWLAPEDIDLALLRVETPKGFVPTLKYQFGRQLSMGQKVFAIGNPVGLNWTYTDGVISALRKNRFGSKELTVVQIQTPLNHGNSGGGLYDLEGYLIGVNTWIYSKTVTEGLNFSIFIDEFFSLLGPEWSGILGITDATQPAEKEGQE